MSKLRTVTRRTFLVGSAVIAGGVAFGTYAVRKPHTNPLQANLKPDEAAFNPWVLINADKITLIVPHMDMGQGAASMQAALIAEELDVEFGQFDISFGQPSGAYYNTAMAEEAVPFLSTDTSLSATMARKGMGAAIKLLGAQVTGGSTSVPDSFVKLRMAGATARETLKLAAAKKFDVSVNDLKTGNASVQLPDGQQVAYTQLAAHAASLTPVTSVELRDPETWRMLGHSMKRLDVEGKSTGNLKYGIDLHMDKMLYAAVKINPSKGGDLKSFDSSRAEKMSGVQKVTEVTNGVAVVASNTWYAINAAKQVDCDWGAAAYPANQAQHWQAVEQSFTSDKLDKMWRNDGDVESVVKTAMASDLAIKAQYRAPYVAHQPLEPINATVIVTDERVDIWVASQLPRFALQQITAVTGHAEENIHLHNQYAGGSFGHRLEFENIKLACEVGLQVPNVPIKLTFSREEDFSQDFTRQIGMSRGQGTVENGHVTAMNLSIATVSSSRSQTKRMGQPAPGPDTQIAAGAWNLPYAIPNFRVSAYAVPELAPTSSWRSVGASTAGFFAECFLDELIHAAGADPIEERLRLCNNPVAKKVIEAVAKMSNWGSPMSPNQGRGIAFVESFGVPIAEVVEVTNTSRGIKIDRVYVAADVGKVIDPVNFENLVQGGVIWGLGHAMNCEITYANGKAEQSNYHAHEGMRIHQCPEIIVNGLENGQKIRGIGEPPVPPAAPALANAIFAATGQRIREMPFNKHVRFI